MLTSSLSHAARLAHRRSKLQPLRPPGLRPDPTPSMRHLPLQPYWQQRKQQRRRQQRQCPLQPLFHLAATRGRPRRAMAWRLSPTAGAVATRAGACCRPATRASPRTSPGGGTERSRGPEAPPTLEGLACSSPRHASSRLMASVSIMSDGVRFHATPRQGWRVMQRRASSRESTTEVTRRLICGNRHPALSESVSTWRAECEGGQAERDIVPP